MFLVYKTDVNHSYNSRDLIAVATTQSLAMQLCKIQSHKEGENLDINQLYNLRNLKQTQGYNGAGEFQYEEVETDKIF